MMEYVKTYAGILEQAWSTLSDISITRCRSNLSWLNMHNRNECTRDPKWQWETPTRSTRNTSQLVMHTMCLNGLHGFSRALQRVHWKETAWLTGACESFCHNQQNKLKKWSGKDVARYCRQACQRADWRGHKIQCQRLIQELKNRNLVMRIFKNTIRIPYSLRSTVVRDVLKCAFRQIMV